MDNGKVTILIVDDVKTNIEILSDMLSDSYDIMTAESGEQALEIMRGNVGKINAVLLDIVMPGMDGCGVLEQMSADSELRALPVIAVTSDDSPETRRRVLDLGAVDYVERTGDMSDLKHRVKSVLRLCELDRIRVENELIRKQLRTERQLSALMDNIPGGIAIINVDGDNTYCSFFNNELLVLFGMTATEFNDQFSDDPAPAWLRTFNNEAEDSNHFSYNFAIGDENDPEACQWIQLIAGGMGERQGVREIYCVFLDINAEKRQELRANEVGKQLRENENHLEALLDNAPGGIAYAERDNFGKMNVLFASLGLADMLGYPDYESCMDEIGKDPSVGVSEEDITVIRHKIDKCLSSGKHLNHSFRCAAKDGSELWLMLRGQLVFNDDGRLCLYAFITNITKEKQIEEELRVTAYFDPLTGLYNRSAFMKNAQRLLDENPRREFSVLKLNISNFKVINDLLGMDVGDKVLITIADTLRSIISSNGVYARFAADNFMMLIPYSERSVHPQTILDAVQKAVEDISEVPHDIQFYIGVYKITDRSLSVENMTDRAAIACRSINGSFRVHIAYYDEKMRRQMLEEQEITDESRRALENGEFYVCYQPIYGIKAKKFVSAEALVRWNHPTKGMISPVKFIPVFEKNGFIAELDLYVLEQVCIYQKKRRDQGLPPFPISVNVSRMSLYNPNLFDMISDLTDRYRVDPQYFRIEITESAYNDNPAQLLDTVGRLRRKCYPVLMDDFGSGYSSLNTLKDIPIDVLKLDMKFMQGFEKNGRVGTIVTSVARMSKWLNVPMLAEGVETREQYEFLESIGCAYIQGFYFSRPVPENDFTQLVAQEEFTAYDQKIESYGMGEDVNELLGSNKLVSKFISSVFGGLGIYEMVDGRLELIRANEGYMQIMGYSPADFNEENTNVWSRMPPEDAEISRNACLEALKTDKAVRASIRRYDRNGNLLDLEGIHRKLGGTDENPIFCIAFNDITEKLRSERFIEKAESRIEEVLNVTDSVIIDIDYEENGFFSIGSLSAYGMDLNDSIGYVQGEIGFDEIAHPDDLEKIRVFHDNKSPGKVTEEFRMFNKADGRYYWWRFSEIRTYNDDGNLVRLIGVGTNIDAEKTAEIELAEANERINAAMDNFNEGILILEISKDDIPNVLFSNSSFWKIIGKPEVNGGEFFNHVEHGADEGDLGELSDKIREGGTLRFTYQTVRDDGKSVWIEITAARSRFGASSDRTYMVVVSDVTEQYESKARMDAIMRSFEGGVALITELGGKLRVDYANGKFYEVLRVDPGDSEKLGLMLSEAVPANTDTGDLHIKSGDGSSRVVRIHLERADFGSTEEESFVVVANDVTVKRTEAANRIAERSANAAAGLYDVVYELNVKNKTIKLMSSRRDPNRADLGRPNPLDVVVREWSEKFVHPDDVSKVQLLVTLPLTSPDFTDTYAELRWKYPDENEYRLFSAVLVRSDSDLFTLFIRDKARVDSSAVSGQLEEINRLYRTVAEQTRTTVVEFDHIANRLSCSPSISEFWAAKLIDTELTDRDAFRKGLAVYPDDIPVFADFTDRVYSNPEPQSVTLRLKMADSNHKWCRLTVTLQRDESGIVRKSLCTINVIEDEVNAQKKTDEILRKTVRHIPVGVAIFRIENGMTVPVYFSDKIFEMYGLKPGDLNAPVLPTDDLVRNNKLFKGSEGGYALDAFRADGSKFRFGVKYRVTEENGELWLYAAVTDVPERLVN